MITATHVDC